MILGQRGNPALAVFQQAESEKPTPCLKIPRAIQYVSSWFATFVDTDILQKCQAHVGLFSFYQNCATAELFRSTGSCMINEFADEIQSIPHENSVISNYSNIIFNDIFRERVLEGDIPPLVLSANPSFLHGHIIDGNHRAITALLLAKEKGKKIVVPALIGEMHPTKQLYLNTMNFALASSTNSKEAGQLALKRIHASRRASFRSLLDVVEQLQYTT